jgi:two-component system osmolarity sensor histidine kinase EnvZ
MKIRSISLLTRNGLTIGITLFIFQIIIVSAILFFLLIPVIRHSSENMASIIFLSMDKWSLSGPTVRLELIKELELKYDFKMKVNQAPQIIDSRPMEPYLIYLEQFLNKKSDLHQAFWQDANQSNLYWIKLKQNKKTFYIAIPLHQLGGKPLEFGLSIIFSGLLLTFISSWLLAIHLNRPIYRLINAIQELGKGHLPIKLPEKGCKELIVLAESFNDMVKQIDDLLENRTIMLAGISHDLRTPLTRMTLCLEMLPDNFKHQKLDSIGHEIILMNDMIGHYMELARCLSEEKIESHDLKIFISLLLEEIKYEKITILFEGDFFQQDQAYINFFPISLKRILINFIANSIKYAVDKPILLNIKQIKQVVIFEVIDQGPGIQDNEIENVFKPFYRLEKSRNIKTGGSGLGLAIVSRLADAHDWHVELKNCKTGGLIAQVSIPFFATLEPKNLS